MNLSTYINSHNVFRRRISVDAVHRLFVVKVPPVSLEQHRPVCWGVGKLLDIHYQQKPNNTNCVDRIKIKGQRDCDGLQSKL